MGLFSSDPPSHFPVVKGKRLDGTAVRFPHDLPADATLLIVSFRDEFDPLSDQWARLGDRIAASHGDRFAVLELPVVNSKLKLLGGLATMGIRGQVDHDEERQRTIPIYVDVKPFRKALQVKSSDVYPMLVARDGRIVWRGDGDIDMDEVTDLEAAVADVLSVPVPALTGHPDIDELEPDGEDEPGGEDKPDGLTAADGRTFPPDGRTLPADAPLAGAPHEDPATDASDDTGSA